MSIIEGAGKHYGLMPKAQNCDACTRTTVGLARISKEILGCLLPAYC